MNVFRRFEDLPHFKRGVATIGSFDGVHCGHRVLLGRVSELAAETGGESVVFTFEPHPRITLGCDDNLKLLNTTEEKLHLLEHIGIDNVVIIPFTLEFSRLTPRDFIVGCIAPFGIEYLVVGYNHHFGHNKSGDFNLLSSLEGDTGLKVAEVEQQRIATDKVSSTVIRKLIGSGDMARAEKMLSAPYLILGHINEAGEILYGDSRYKLLPPSGEYDVCIDTQPAKIRITDDGRIFLCGNIGRTAEFIKIEFTKCYPAM